MIVGPLGRCESFVKKLRFPQLIQKFSIRKFITRFIRTSHSSLFWARLIRTKTSIFPFQNFQWQWITHFGHPHAHVNQLSAVRICTFIYILWQCEWRWLRTIRLCSHVYFLWLSLWQWINGLCLRAHPKHFHIHRNTHCGCVNRDSIRRNENF